MRYPASEKAEIIQLVEQSHLPAKRTLDKLGIPRALFFERVKVLSENPNLHHAWDLRRLAGSWESACKPLTCLWAASA